MTLGEFSRFKNTPRTIFENQETFGTWKEPPWLVEKPSSEFIRIYKVNSNREGRPDRISYDIYGTPLLAWVLISFNARHNNDKIAYEVLNWPKAGSIIEYPIDSIVFPQVA